MASVVGVVKSVNGHFFAKDVNGNVIDLKPGDKILNDMIVFGGSDNQPTAKIDIENSSNHNTMVLEGSQSQLFDSTVIAKQGTFGDIAVSQESVNGALSPDIQRNSTTDNQNLLSNMAENAALISGQTQRGLQQNQFDMRSGESVNVSSDLREGNFHETGTVSFDRRIGDSVDINSDLRKTWFKTDDLEHDDDGVLTNQDTGALEKASSFVASETPVVQHAEIFIDNAVCHENDGVITFKVSLNGPIGTDVTFDFSTRGDTAVENSDFAAFSGKGVIKAGELSTTITIHITNDSEVESSEQFFVNISNPSSNATIIDTQAVGTVLDSDTAPEETSNDVVIKLIALDGDGNPILNNGNYTFENDAKEGGDANYMALAFSKTNTTFAEGSELSEQLGSVTISTVDTNSAVADVDYVTQTTIEVPLATQFSVPTIDDYLADGGEDFKVEIDSYIPPSTGDTYENVTVDGVVTTTIVDGVNDAVPNEDVDTIYLQLDTDSAVKEDNGAVLTHQLHLVDKDGNPMSLPDGETIKVTLSYSSDSTEAGDFSLKTSTFTITGDGGDTYSFSNVVADDFLSEGDESYVVKISSVSNEATHFENIGIDSAHNEANGVISDAKTGDDEVANQDVDTVYAVLSGDDTVYEGSTAQYSVSLLDKDGNPVTVSQDTVVNVVFTNGSAQDADTQYSNDDTISVTIVAGNSTAPLDVDTIDDYMSDNNEDYTLSIASIPDHEFENIDIDGYTDTSGVEHEATQTTTILDDSGTPNTADDGVEATHDLVEIKLIACDLDGNKLTDSDGNYIVANEVNEGKYPSYMALAFAPNTTTFNASTETPTQEGTVEVTFANDGATGVSSFTPAFDGSEDFDNDGQTVTLGQAFSTATFDDFYSDDGETFTVQITPASYTPPTSSAGYENVHINTDVVTTTIKDDITLSTPNGGSVDEDNFDATESNTDITDTQSLGITTADGYDDYTLAFDGEPTFTSDDSNYTTLQSDGVDIEYVVDGVTTTAYAGSGRTDDDRVFVITLNKNSAGGSDDDYTYTQYKNIDHPTADNDDNVVLTFGFTATDDGQTSDTKTFTVTVNDSMPRGDDQSVVTDEDSNIDIVISEESFDGGVINLDNGVDGASDVNSGDSIDIYDVDKDDVVGSLLNNGDGTLTFTPNANYSGDTNGFSYAVSDGDGDSASANVAISVTPVADTPIMPDDITVETFEDANTTDSSSSDGNQREGGDVKVLGLALPTLSSQVDQTDQNGDTSGDNPERFGFLKISFTSSEDFGTATIGYDTDGDGTLDATLQTITNSSEFTIDITDVDGFHPADLGSGTYSLTQAQYESLAIIHDEDNATNIKMKVYAHMREVDDNGDTLDISENTDSEYVLLDVKAVTDDISLEYNSETNSSGDDIGDISTTDNTNDTFTFTSVDEDSSGTTIDLKLLLTKTSGVENDSSPDLDGSEHRSYTFSGLPEGTIITLGANKVAVASDGTATINFPDNTDDDPEFSMQIAPNYSGDIDAKIVLNVVDTDIDSTVTIDTLTQTLYLKGTVDPVADVVTLQVKQAVGDEDAGRTAGNTANDSTADDIDAPENGIDLDIKVTSDDDKDISDGTNTDDKESYTVIIGDSSSYDGIPDGASIYYNTTLIDKDTSDVSGITVTDNEDGSWKLQIDDFDNDVALKYIPVHNDDSDYVFNIDAYSTDNGNDSITQSLQIDVTVNDVADVPMNDDLSTTSATDDDGDSNTYNYVTAEDSGVINLKAVFATPADISSYDDDSSESVSLLITNLSSEFDINNATFLGGSGEDRKWVFTLDQLNNDEITLSSNTNFSGEIDFNISTITTENEGDSKTDTPQDVSILVTPVSEDTLITTESQNEDELKNLDFSINLTDNDETLTTLWIDVNNLPSGVTLKDGDGNTLVADDGDYVTLSGDAINDVWANLDANLAQNYTLSLKYEVTDTTTDTNGNNYSNAVVYDNISYDVSVTPITDTTSTDATAQDSDAIHIDSSDTDKIYLDSITANDGKFDVDIDITVPDDTDGSESATRVVVDGMPVGVLAGYTNSDGNFIAGTMSGSSWFIDIPDVVLDSSSKTTTLTFKITDDYMDNGTGTEYPITITTYNQDGSEAQEENSSTTLTFVDNIDGDGVTDSLDATIDLKSPTITEDTEFSLNDLITINYDSNDNAGDNSHDGAIYTIAIKNLENSSISADDLSKLQTYDDGNGIVYVVSGTKGSDIEDKLSDIHLVPNSDYNQNNAATALSLDIDLTAYMPSNSAINSTDSESYSNNSVVPVTDEVTISTNINDGNETLEDGSYSISISLSSVDDPYQTIVQASDDSSTATTITINYSSGVYGTLSWSGGSYTFDSNNTSAEVPVSELSALTFTPVADASGNVTFTYEVYTIEDNASNIATTSGDIVIDITPVVDGLDLSTLDGGASGNEDDFIQVVLGSSLDTDGSETAKSILLDDIPNGFLVYVGDSGSQTLALNAGDNGSGTTFDLNGDGQTLVNYNTWSIPLNSDGTIPDIWIKAPENWSGDVPDITLTTIIDDGGVSSTISKDFTLTVNPDVDSLTLNTTKTFGSEGEDIALNLNANVVDLDGSETVTLTLSGLGDGDASFKEDGTTIDSVYDSDSDTYTLTNISATHINDLSIVHGAIDADVSVTAKMVESDGSESSLVDTNNTFNINIRESIASSDDDVLLYKSTAIDGLDGEDTLVLNGTSIDYSNVTNMEILDLGAGDNTLSNLTLKDVLDMTDGDNELIILGDNANDEVTLKNEDGDWSKGSQVTENGHTFDVYTNSGDSSVTVKVEDYITDSIV